MSNDFPQPICEQIWNGKYRLITPNPHIENDETVSDTWNRIADACADSPITQGPTGEKVFISDVTRMLNGKKYYDALEDFKFLPAGRIIAGAGSGRNVTLFNCYVMGNVPDDISGIFAMLREAALTMQQGGGIGYDFSTLRPAGSPVKGVDADASGPLTFMDVWNAMCKTIMSAGARRGAMMATMRCDHPDIKEFITAKHDASRFRMFNMSVLCTDQFMTAVKNNSSWNLMHSVAKYAGQVPVTPLGSAEPQYIYEEIQAKDLWNAIMKSTYAYAEPGVLFIDRINYMNNLWYVEEIRSTNPCGEQPLPPYGACLLGSVNLAKMVHKPFTDEAWINWNEITKAATMGVRMLDAVIDMSMFPLPQQREEALAKRRMGIGITGLADMLFMLGETYGSKAAAETAEEVMKTVTLACYRESIQLAKLYGPCSVTETVDQRIQYLQSGFMKNMPEEIRNDIELYGIRNALLTSIAPTGTISMYAGNVSSGIEPIFAAEYTRKILKKDGITHDVEVVRDYAVHLRLGLIENEMISEEKYDSIVTAQTLKPEDHLVMMAAVQPWVDSSISKTINCPEDISFEDFENIYTTAYHQNNKGCTTYRPNDVTGSVLSVESDDKPEPVAVTQSEVAVLVDPMNRPDNLTGTTYKLKWDTKSYYITINDYVDHKGHIIPFEIFINSSVMDSMQWTIALTRMISAIYRRGGSVKFVGQELKRISDPAGGSWINKQFIPSFVALLGKTIEEHMIMLERLNFDGYIPMEATPGGRCKVCNELTVIIQGGCKTCTSCGDSKCG